MSDKPPTPFPRFATRESEIASFSMWATYNKKCVRQVAEHIAKHMWDIEDEEGPIGWDEWKQLRSAVYTLLSRTAPNAKPSPMEAAQAEWEHEEKGSQREWLAEQKRKKEEGQ